MFRRIGMRDRGFCRAAIRRAFPCLRPGLRGTIRTGTRRQAARGGPGPMQLSQDRILTTHVGSLPRPSDLLVLLEARERGEEFDQAVFEARLAEAVREVVARQVAAGIDSVCDGEQSKISYTFYVRHRLAGIGTAPGDALDKPPATGAHRDIADHPEFAARLHAARGGTSGGD